MKKTLNRIKTGLSTLWVSIVSFFSKVMGQSFDQMNYMVEGMYWVENPIDQQTLLETIIKLVRRPLIGITFIVWIISLIKIKKTKDKTQKKKKIKRTIIIISILVVLIIACLLLPLLLKKY